METDFWRQFFEFKFGRKSFVMTAVATLQSTGGRRAWNWKERMWVDVRGLLGDGEKACIVAESGLNEWMGLGMAFPHWR